MSKYTLGKRCPQPRWPTYRTMYPVYENGNQLIAFIGMKTGWGKSWRVFQLDFAKGENCNVEGMSPRDTSASPGRIIRDNKPETLQWYFDDPDNRKAYKSREEMIQALNRMKSTELLEAESYLRGLHDTLTERHARLELLKKMMKCTNCGGCTVNSADDIKLLEAMMLDARQAVLASGKAIDTQSKRVDDLKRAIA